MTQRHGWSAQGWSCADCSIHRLKRGQADNEGDDDNYGQRNYSNSDYDNCCLFSADTYVLSTLITDPSRHQQSQHYKTINQPVCTFTSYIGFQGISGTACMSSVTLTLTKGRCLCEPESSIQTKWPPSHLCMPASICPPEVTLHSSLPMSGLTAGSDVTFGLILSLNA